MVQRGSAWFRQYSGTKYLADLAHPDTTITTSIARETVKGGQANPLYKCKGGSSLQPFSQVLSQVPHATRNVRTYIGTGKCPTHACHQRSQKDLLFNTYLVYVCSIHRSICPKDDAVIIFNQLSAILPLSSRSPQRRGLHHSVSPYIQTYKHICTYVYTQVKTILGGVHSRKEIKIT